MLWIDLSDSGVSLDEALNLGDLRIMAVVGPADDSDYRPVKAVSVTKAPLIAGLRKKLGNVSAVQPILAEIEHSVAHCEAYSPW